MDKKQDVYEDKAAQDYQHKIQPVLKAEQLIGHRIKGPDGNEFRLKPLSQLHEMSSSDEEQPQKKTNQSALKNQPAKQDQPAGQPPQNDLTQIQSDQLDTQNQPAEEGS